MIQRASELLARLRQIHEAIRDRVVASCEQQSIEHLSAIVGAQAGDTIFALDKISEEVLEGPRARLGPPWTKDHRVAFAAAILAGWV